MPDSVVKSASRTAANAVVALLPSRPPAVALPQVTRTSYYLRDLDRRPS